VALVMYELPGFTSYPPPKKEIGEKKKERADRPPEPAAHCRVSNRLMGDESA
jgi:hypothetical protein